MTLQKNTGATVLRFGSLLAVVVAALLPAAVVRAHDPLLDLPEPTSVPEAWNVINASITNIETLLLNNQLREIPFQVANCSPAIRTLIVKLPDDSQREARRAQLQHMIGSGAAIIVATREKSDPLNKARQQYDPYRAEWERIRAYYAPAELNAEVYVCPMHPLDRHLDAHAKCSICEMSLIRRRIPPSVTYEKPGAASMKLMVWQNRALLLGREASVVVRLARLDGSPVAPADLLVMHTQKLHLLIIDRALEDYHHEHPTPLENRPGEYAFKFTPRRPGPYRVFADVVPAATSVQEFVVADISAEVDSDAVIERDENRVDEVDGLRFELAFDPKQQVLRVGQEVTAQLSVKDREGKPFGKLEPVMGAYAHLVGFNEDRKTIVHIHPLGDEPKSDRDRGGPTLNFRFYPSSSGYTRFYAQVNIGGVQKFARFGVMIQQTGEP